MIRALIQCVIYFYYLRVSRNASRAESLPLKARTVRPPKGRPWNQKNLDYEIETTPRYISADDCIPPWNQKNLDYEIETGTVGSVRSSLELEIKRTSITRLKQSSRSDYRRVTADLKSKEPRLRDWNPNANGSSMKLKPAWNQKNLDYEIETCQSCLMKWRTNTWNQKNLDYEIETILAW